jgi:hypothetical protein
VARSRSGAGSAIHAADEGGFISTAQVAPETEWLPKQQAAQLLGCSERQLDRRYEQGHVEKRTLPRGPLERTAAVVYSKADIEALKNNTPNTYSRAVKETNVRPEAGHTSDATYDESPAPISPAVSNDANGMPPASSLARIDPGLKELLEVITMRLRPAPEPPAPALKPWIPLEEASAISGLPQDYLVARARDGAPWALNTGTVKMDRARRASLRFNREALMTMREL